MRLLILGGSGFLGRHVATDAVGRGWDVTTFNRGGRPPVPGVAVVRGDRLRPADLEPLAHGRWDAVVDTWSADPVAVRDAAAALEPVAARYLYVSSASVYADLTPRRDSDDPADRGRGPSEDDPVVSADPGARATDYAADKRGGELAALAAFGTGRTLLARAGLILGPGEDVGRLPWWLERLARGGPTLAPGPPGLPLQLIDARDVAAFLLDHVATDLAGPVNVVGPAATTTMRDVLEAATAVTGGRAELVWCEPEGVEPWTELPLWLPADHEAGGLLGMDTTRARAAGLRVRPVAETVADTWAAGPVQPRPDRPAVGLSPEREREALGRYSL